MRIKSFGDGVADEGGTLLLEEFDLPPLLLDQRTDPRRLAVKEGGDGALLIE